MTGLQGALGWALVHSLWQGAAVALLLAVALALCQTARARYLLASGGMAAMVLAFAVTLAVCWSADRPVKKVTGAHPAALRLAPRPDSMDRGGIDTLRESGPPRWFVPVWLGGVSLFYCYSLAAWLAAKRLKTRGAFAAPAEWQRRLQHLAGELGLRRTIALMESCMIDVPVMMGYLRPVILLPLGVLSGLGAEQVEAILIHELAHIRRYDYLVNVMQTLVEGMLFYHPAVWWVGSVMRGEREHCCDDMVVALQGDARGYAATLARLELSRGAVREPALAATGGNLMRRIHRLMQQQEGPRVAAPLISAAVLLATATLVVAAWQTQTPPVPAEPQRKGPQHLVEPLPYSSVEPIPQAATPEAAPRVRPTPYQKWLNEDVAYIITDGERAAFKALTTDEERENFIEQFWLIRDPTPGTVENEYKEEHYRRIAYANEHYSTQQGLPGWKTDRGRIYITYGPPDEIEDHSSGGAYVRPAEQGGGTTITDPFQQWRYRYIEGIGNNVIIEFVDPTRTGEFRMTVDPSEKDALLHAQLAKPPQPPAELPLKITVNVLPSPSPDARLATVSVPIEMLGHTTQVLVRITTLSQRRPVSNVEEELDGLSGLYSHVVPLVPGSYRAIVVVKDKITGVIHRGETAFDAF